MSASDESSRLLGTPAIPATGHIGYGAGDLEPLTTNMTTITANGDNSVKWPQYVAALSATGGALAAGTILGWSSPTERHLVTDGEYGFPIDANAFSWVGSAVTLGAACVCFPIGIILDIIGRKWTMLSLVVPFTIGWVLLIWAQNLAMMIVGRVLLGIAGGAFCIAAPMYTAEIAQKEIRGTVGSYFQLMVTVGILFVYGVGAGVNAFWLSVICAFIPLIFGGIFFFMPETPQYLVMKNREDEAKKSLLFLRGKNYDADTELAEIATENNLIKANNVSVFGALKRKSTLRALMISIGLMLFQQLSGINAVIFYVSTIFKAANGNSDDEPAISDNVAAIIVGSVQVVATLVSTLVVDKLGRRILLLLSSTVMAVCTILLGIYFYMDSHPDKSVDNMAWLPIFSVCLFIIAFSLGFGPIPWFMIGEIFAPDIKGVASSIAGTSNWLLAFVVTKTFTDLRDAVGLGETFWIFSGLTVLGTIFVFFLVPETKGKTLQEIQAMLGENNSTVSATAPIAEKKDLS